MKQTFLAVVIAVAATGTVAQNRDGDPGLRPEKVAGARNGKLDRLTMNGGQQHNDWRADKSTVGPVHERTAQEWYT